MAEASRDQNRIPTMLGVSSADGITPVAIYVDPVTHRALVDMPDTVKLTSAASYTTDTGTSLDVSVCNLFVITAQAGALKFNNPSGSPIQGQRLMIRIKDSGAPRALTYDTQYRALGVSLPTTTVASKTLYMGFIFNSTDTKWDCIATAQEA